MSVEVEVDDRVPCARCLHPRANAVHTTPGGCEYKLPPPVVFTYTNYRGETRVRACYPTEVFWGDCPPYHPDLGWVMEGWDLEKKAIRAYWMEDIVGFQKTQA